jgi:serine/threonine-protein kinase
VGEPRKIGKYELLEKIGEGGFAVVFKGRDPFIKRLVAIKLCRSEDEGLRRRFLREAEIAGSLQHRNIVTAFDFGFEAAGPYLVQEYLAGEDLKHKIQRRDPIGLGRKLGYLRQIALGLDYAHGQGVLHRDVKPGNVRVLDNDRVKILDFGIARLATADTRLTTKGSILGTAGYLPPEQLLGGEVDARGDVFSFGALAYELLAYRRPFAGSTMTELFEQVLRLDPPPLTDLWPECPPELWALVGRCLEKDRERRYPGFGELILDLTPILARARAADRAQAQAGRLPGPAPRPPAAPVPELTGGTRRSLEDTRPLALPKEVEAAARGDASDRGDASELNYPEPPSAPGLRERQEVESSWMSLPPTLAVAKEASSARWRWPGRKRRPPQPAPAVAAGEPAPPRRPPAVRGGGRREPKRRRWIVAAAAGLAALAVGAAGVAWLAGRPETPIDRRPPIAAETGAPAAAAGVLVIDAVPWGEVVRVVDASGAEVPLPDRRSTPLSVLVPPGVYQADLEPPGGGGLASCRTEVTASAAGRCRAELAAVTADDYFREAGWWR